MPRKNRPKQTLESPLKQTEQDEKRLNTYPGQANWAVDKTHSCRECKLYESSGYRANGPMKDGHCRKARSLMAGKRMPSFPHWAFACSFFDENPLPPSAYRKF